MVERIFFFSPIATASYLKKLASLSLSQNSRKYRFETFLSVLIAKCLESNSYRIASYSYTFSSFVMFVTNHRNVNSSSSHKSIFQLSDKFFEDIFQLQGALQVLFRKKLPFTSASYKKVTVRYR